MIEPSEIARWERNLRTMLRKAADEDPEGFAVVDQLLRSAVSALPYAAELTRRRHGYSWADMGRGLGVSKAAAWERLRGEPRGVSQLLDVDGLDDTITQLVTHRERP